MEGREKMGLSKRQVPILENICKVKTDILNIQLLISETKNSRKIPSPHNSRTETERQNFVHLSYHAKLQTQITRTGGLDENFSFEFLKPRMLRSRIRYRQIQGLGRKCFLVYRCFLIIQNSRKEEITFMVERGKMNNLLSLLKMMLMPFLRDLPSCFSQVHFLISDIEMGFEGMNMQATQDFRP